MSDMQVAVGFRRKTGMNPAFIDLVAKTLLDDFFNKIEWASGLLFVRIIHIFHIE
jgi:hypothetical protein